MNMKNKYKNAEEFIKEFKKSSFFSPLLKLLVKSGEIKNITKERLKTYGIHPDVEGYYRKNQFFLLSQKIKKELQRKYGDLSSLYEKIDKQILGFIFNFGESPKEIKKFLLITLSDKFREETQKIRKRYGIQVDGFRNTKEVLRWILKLPNSSFDAFSRDVFSLFQSYKLKLPHVIGLNYVLRGLYSDALIRNAKEIEKESSCFIISNHLLFEDLSPKITNKISSPASLAIAIRRPITKKELKAYIDKHWKDIKRKLKKSNSQIPINKKFIRDWLIFYYHKRGKSNKEILKLIKFDPILKKEKVSESQIKQTIARTKRRIKKLEMVTQK